VRPQGAVPGGDADHLSSVWEAPFAAAGAERADLFHLHHLTSQHDAVALRWPDVPLVAHLHGTEIKLVEAIVVRAAVAGALDLTLAAMPGAVDHAAIDTGALDGPQLDLLGCTRRSGRAAHLSDPHRPGEGERSSDREKKARSEVGADDVGEAAYR